MTRITVPDKATPIKAPEYSHNTSRFNGRVPEYSIDQSLPAEDFAKNNGDDLSATWHKLLKPHVNSFNWFTKTGLTLQSGFGESSNSGGQNAKFGVMTYQVLLVTVGVICFF